jgi:hypothetical protein
MAQQQASERRAYIRLDSVFPVQFRLVSLDGMNFLSGWVQGFTNNISKGGLCLRINNIDAELAKTIKSQVMRLTIEIENPFTKSSLKAMAKVAWFKEPSAEEGNKFLVGLSYEQVDAVCNKRFMRYVWLRKLFFPVTATAVFFLALGFAFNSCINIKLIKGNKALVGQLVSILQDSSIAKQKINDINRDKEELQLKIKALQARIQGLETEKTQLAEGERQEENKALKKIEALNKVIEQLTQEKGPLQEKLLVLEQKESIVTGELLRLDKNKILVAQANFDKMYHWLAVHQNPRTGLVMSFEGDSNVANWAFTYDQSLVAQAYLYFTDLERAKKIFDFFAKRAKRREGLFFNAYYANDGSPVEYTIHSGPNIWLAIAMAHYTRKIKDVRYLHVAEEIADIMIRWISQDSDGGWRGGPNVEWYSTEHNLDAYALFDMLYALTGKNKYDEAKNTVAGWLLKHIYDKLDVPVKRGKGDATIATDTYAWSIAALGPQKLEELGMNPDKVIEFAEQSCGVEVCYVRPEGSETKLRGFDFAAQKHLARGGVVSTEWTAQMILAFRIMKDYYNKKGMAAKARTYELKADHYLAELCTMIISSPSPSGQGEGCLPYASCDAVDTGHGWMTPQGKATGSVSATAYTLFAYYNYNPLELKE